MMRGCFQRNSMAKTATFCPKLENPHLTYPISDAIHINCCCSSTTAFKIRVTHLLMKYALNFYLYLLMEPPHNPIHKDYYNILEVEYDATDDKIRLNYRKLALKWHPDKHKGDAAATAKFQQINEAYKVLRDPVKKLEYDLSGDYAIHKYTLKEYLARFKGMILSSNGLGINQTSFWSEQLMGTEDQSE